LQKIKAQMVLFGIPCEADSNATSSENLKALLNKLQQFAKGIAQYVS